MRNHEGRMAAKLVTLPKGGTLPLLALFCGIQTGLAGQAVERNSARVVISQGPVAVVEFVRHARLKGSDVIVTIRDHRRNKSLGTSPSQYIDVRLSPLAESARSPNTRDSYLYPTVA